MDQASNHPFRWLWIQRRCVPLRFLWTALEKLFSVGVVVTPLLFRSNVILDIARESLWSCRSLRLPIRLWWNLFSPPFLKAGLSSSLHRHWLTSSYIVFAVPYFVYDIYAMFMCYWYKLRVKGHEEASAAPQHMGSALISYLRREFLMVLHHVVMVTVCFPVSVVTVTHSSSHLADIWVVVWKHNAFSMCWYSILDD